MREVDTLKALIPPINIVPGTTLNNSTTTQVGHGTVGTDYVIERAGWYCELTDPGPLSGSTRTASPYYQLQCVHRTEIEWSPFARMDMALVPLGQNVAEGKSFESFHSEYTADSTFSGGLVFPGWNGVVCRVVDMWTSEKVEDLMISNLGDNGLFPGTEPGWPLDVYSGLNMPIANPANIEFKLRSDQIISARYREMVSTSTAPTSQYFGGQLMTISDTTVGGNASISDKIHHTRYVRFVSSNNGDDNIRNSGFGGVNAFNYAKVGFFIPAAIDTLTIGLDKIESDAEWSTIARRGASR